MISPQEIFMFMTMIVLAIIIAYEFFIASKLFTIATTSKELINDFKKQKEELELEKIHLQEDIDTLNFKCSCYDSRIYEYNEIIKKLEDNKNKLQQEFNEEKQKMNYAMAAYCEILENNYRTEESKHDSSIKELRDKFKEESHLIERSIKESKDQLKEIKSLIRTGNEEILKRKEKLSQIDFHRIPLTEDEINDISALRTIKKNLRYPTLIDKLIWSQFFQKKATDLCNRVLGTDKTCGIYSIENITTGEKYIGQSVDIASRWKDHIKCGLGIDASSTNKLYCAMQKDGVENFIFHKIEDTPREKLNEREKFWIDFYDSFNFGYNSTKGNG